MMVRRQSSGVAAYELVAGVLLGQPVAASTGERARALPAAAWHRLLMLEGCAVQFHLALRRRADVLPIPEPVTRLLQAVFETAVRNAVLVQEQLAEIAALAGARGIRVLALKGAARLLRGEMVTRSIADLDLLATRHDATAFHELLCRELGYTPQPSDVVTRHHLAGLLRSRGVGVDIHTRLSDRAQRLDDDIWLRAELGRILGVPVDVPCATDMVLHTLEHAVAVNWDLRYRLRDVLDVASLWGADVDEGRVREHVAASPHRSALARLLSASHAVRGEVPSFAGARVGIVHRVGRARAAAALACARADTAARAYRYAGVLAEASPRGVGRAAWHLVRRGARAAGTALAAVSFGCVGVTTPEPTATPEVLFVSHVDGQPAIFRTRNDTTLRLSASGADDTEPHSAAGFVVFTSRRDGDPEVYLADLELGSPRRLTTSGGFDGEPALDPSGQTIAFVSDRSGTPRVWLMDSDGGNPRPLATGSPSYVPERAPVWSIAGDRLAFTSTRTGTSQGFVVARSGGDAKQVTRESTGVFDVAWNPDGETVLYTSLAGTPAIMKVSAIGGEATPFASDARGLGDVACGATECVAALDPFGAATAIALLSPTRGVRVLVAGAEDHRQLTVVSR